MVNLIKQARESRGWTSARLNAALREAARATRTPIASRTSLRVMISAWENDHRTPDATYQSLLQHAFALPPDALGFSERSVGESSGNLTSLVHLRMDGVDIECARNYFEVQLAAHVVLDRVAGPGLLVETVEAQALQLRKLVENRSEEAVELASRYLEFTGWLRQDSGDLTCALRWTNDAIDMADRADAPRLVVYNTMRKSSVLGDAGEFDGANFVARISVEMARQSAPEHEAVCLRQVAIAEAHLRNETAARDALEAALAQAPHEVEDTSGGLSAYCTQSYLEMENASCLLALGDPSAAVAACSRALDTWPGGQSRDRALCLGRLATACLGANDVDAACSAAVAAVEQVRRAPSARTVAGLRALSRRLQPFRASPHVRQFRETLATVA